MIRGKTRVQLFLPDEMHRRLAAMAKAQKRPRSDLLLEMIDAFLNQRSGPHPDDRILSKLDRIARALDSNTDECIVMSHSLSRFIRHQLIYNAALPMPSQDAQALGKRQYEAFLESVAKMMAKRAGNDNEIASSPEVNRV